MFDKATLQIIDRREMLRVKVKSLAVEAQIIRKEEQRARGQLRYELELHRKFVVRKAARHAHLAYGFIRGLTLEQMEPTRKTDPDWETVRKMLKKYGPRNFVEPECMTSKVKREEATCA